MTATVAAPVLPFERGLPVAVLRSPSTRTARAVARAVVDGGITTLEVTFTVPGALELMSELAERPGVLVGAGTVTTVQQVRAAIAAGARFVVSPGLDAAVVDAARDAGVTALPGVLTPSELLRARRLGVQAVKLFPAGTLGVGYLRALRAVLPDVEYVPTGGIGPRDVVGWLDAGSYAVGIGGVIDSAYQEEGSDGLQVLARRLVALCQQATNGAKAQEAKDA